MKTKLNSPASKGETPKEIKDLLLKAAIPHPCFVEEVQSETGAPDELIRIAWAVIESSALIRKAVLKGGFAGSQFPNYEEQFSRH